MAKFEITSLPNDVKDKILDIQWSMGEDDMREGILGLVNLKDEWVFIDDWSHVIPFSSKRELINAIRKETKRV